MSNVLDQSLRRMASDLDAAAGPILLSEITAEIAGEYDDGDNFSGELPDGQKQRRSRWLLVAASALVAVGLALALTRAGDVPPFDPADVPPMSEELPASGTTLTPEEHLILNMATDVFLDECMTAAGFTWVSSTEQELITQFGSWQPHPGLGLRRLGAAERIGYQDAGAGGLGSPTQAAAIRAMTAAERDAYFAALTNTDDSGSAAVEIMRPDGQPTGASAPVGTDTCWGEAEQQMPHSPNVLYGYEWLIMEEAPAEIAAPVFHDERVGLALGTWQACLVEEAVSADPELFDALDSTTITPNVLARHYAFSGVGDSGDTGVATPTDVEIAVASADARCQKEADLQTVWAVVQAEVTRFHLGDDVIYYDDLAEKLQENLSWAQGVLDSRGIVPPPLD